MSPGHRPRQRSFGRLAAAIAASVILVTAGCGARSSLHGEEDPAAGAGAADASADGASAERHCPPECFAGHRCCAGGCDGPIVPLPSDCCTCLSGEVSSWNCPSGTCGN